MSHQGRYLIHLIRTGSKLIWCVGSVHPTTKTVQQSKQHFFKNILHCLVYHMWWLYKCQSSHPPACEIYLSLCTFVPPGVAHSRRTVIPFSLPLMCPLPWPVSVLFSLVVSTGIVVPGFRVVHNRGPWRRHTSSHGWRVSAWVSKETGLGLHFVFKCLLRMYLFKSTEQIEKSVRLVWYTYSCLYF